MNELRKTFKFGKIAYTSKRKINAVEVEIRLHDTKAGPVFSAVGAIWNGTHTDWACGGQCLDEIAKYIRFNKTFKEIRRLWKLYHLNDMRVGTPKQEAYLKEIGLSSYGSQFSECCEALKKVGLYEDGGMEFGLAWNYVAIPEEDLAKIRTLLAE